MIVLVVLMVLYPLSLGPVVWLERRGYVSGPVWAKAHSLELEMLSLIGPGRRGGSRVVTYNFLPGEFEDVRSLAGAIYKPLRRPYLSSPEFLQAAFDKYLDWWLN